MPLKMDTRTGVQDLPEEKGTNTGRAFVLPLFPAATFMLRFGDSWAILDGRILSDWLRRLPADWRVVHDQPGCLRSDCVYHYDPREVLPIEALPAAVTIGLVLPFHGLSALRANRKPRHAREVSKAADMCNRHRFAEGHLSPEL